MMSIRLLARNIFEDHVQNTIVGSITKGFEHVADSIKPSILAGKLIFLYKDSKQFAQRLYIGGTLKWGKQSILTIIFIFLFSLRIDLSI